jgi:transposase
VVAERRKRRHWSDAEKRMVCAQTRFAGVSVSQVARLDELMPWSYAAKST